MLRRKARVVRADNYSVDYILGSSLHPHLGAGVNNWAAWDCEPPDELSALEQSHHSKEQFSV